MKETRIRIKGGGFRGFLVSIGLVIVGVILVLAVLKGLLGINLAFFRTTLSLKPTTLKLEDIQDLGFLVTSEYFGEVIGTARDYFVRRAIPRAEALAVRLSSSANPEEEKLSDEDADILNAIRGALIRSSGLNPGVIEHINNLKDVANFLRSELQAGSFLPPFSELLLGQLLAKRDIAYLARGSVQAGYNLKDISADRYFYCPSTRTLCLNSQVQIFSRQINPWFIYDSTAGLYVKGFEIISQTNIDLEDEGVYDFLKNIKEECQQRLVDDARREGIEALARESAEHTLENMLKMLKSDIQTVRILPADKFELQKTACPESRKAVFSDR